MVAAEGLGDEIIYVVDHGGRRDVRVSGYVLADDPQPAMRALIAAIGRDPAEATTRRQDYLSVVRDRGGTGERRTELVGSDVFVRPLPASGLAALVAAVDRRAAWRSASSCNNSGPETSARLSFQPTSTCSRSSGHRMRSSDRWAPW